MRILDALLGRKALPVKVIKQSAPNGAFTSEEAAYNSDIELYRAPPGDYHSDKLFLTTEGSIGINCGGYVFVKPIRRWHELAIEELRRAQARLNAVHNDPPITAEGVDYSLPKEKEA